MKTSILHLCFLLFPWVSSANLCSEARNGNISSESKSENRFYKQLFPSNSNGEHGTDGWNERILECNRRRDVDTQKLTKILTDNQFSSIKDKLKNSDLSMELITGNYNFFGLLLTQQKYRYLLSKVNGEWQMIIPYNPIINDIVKNRIDVYMGSNGNVSDWATKLYPESETETVNGVLQLKASAKSIASALCTTSTYFEGKQDKYAGQDDANSHKRDRENKHISLGKIQFSHDKISWSEGCRIKKDENIIWKNSATGNYEKIRPDKWVLEHFIQTAESYWSIDKVFKLKLLLKDYNEDKFNNATLKKLGNNDFIKIRFGTLFMPYGFNQVYKTSIIQFNNFSTMTTDGTYWHEVGHAFGLDDEYGGEKGDKDKDGEKDDKKNSCEHSDYASFDSTKYQMCDGGVTGKRTIYHYIAASRYVLTQICKNDSDCGKTEFCNNRLGINRCLADGTIEVGDACSKNRECKSNKCDGTGKDQVCACKDNGDCGANQFCNNRLGVNRCLAHASLEVGDTCLKNQECKSDRCEGKSGKQKCVCKDDGDCGANQFCNNRLDENRCLAFATLLAGEAGT
ncbi:MAG: hypothetical protein AABY53_00135, partial [Bdellovibrionota bacterium]